MKCMGPKCGMMPFRRNNFNSFLFKQRDDLNDDFNSYLEGSANLVKSSQAPASSQTANEKKLRGQDK